MDPPTEILLPVLTLTTVLPNYRNQFSLLSLSISESSKKLYVLVRACGISPSNIFLVLINIFSELSLLKQCDSG